MITNGTLLGPQERQDLLGFDYILPALHAADERIWKRIVRSKVALATVVEGLIKLRQEFSGKINMEVFLIPGVNDGPEGQAPLATLLKKIKPDLIELNSLDRPGAMPWVQPCPPATLAQWAQALEKLTGIKTVVIARHFTGKEGINFGEQDKIDLKASPWSAAQALLGRRPAAREDLLQTCAVDAAELDHLLQEWLQQKKIIQQGNFYCTPPPKI